MAYSRSPVKVTRLLIIISLLAEQLVNFSEQCLISKIHSKIREISMWFQIFLQNDYEYDEVMRVIQNFQVNLLIIIFNKKILILLLYAIK